MRNEFGKWVKELAIKDKNIIFLTGDLGFMALEEIREAIGPRFVNIGVSEQNMITMAAALASEGLTPLCYSIAPFTVFRPAEQIRLDVCLHNMNVKIIGNGGGYGYGIMGSTHHAIEDIAVLSSFQNMICYVPFCSEDVPNVLKAMMDRKGPAYLRLEKGNLPEGVGLPKYSSIRRIQSGDDVTIISIGPVALNAIKAVDSLKDKVNKSADIFIVSEMPVLKLTNDLKKSILKTRKVVITEEHVSRGGLGENISLLILKLGFSCKTIHLFAHGYQNGLYGSQDYHFKINGLDSKSIYNSIKRLTNEKI